MAADPRQRLLNETLQSLDTAIGSQIYKPNQTIDNANYSLYYEATAPVPIPDVSFNETIQDTTIAILSQDDPGIKAVQVLFSEFVDIYEEYGSADVHLWEEVSHYEQVLSHHADLLQSVLRKAPKHYSYFTNTKQMASLLIDERNTWRLLKCLLNERLSRNDELLEDDMEPIIDVTKDRSDRDIVSQYYDKSPSMREAQTVLDWLERNAVDAQDGRLSDRIDLLIQPSKVHPENTLRAIKNNKESGGYTFGTNSLLVSSLDPDAPVREGKKLHDLDQECENRLVKALLACVRAGQLDEAEELCVQAGQPSMSAALQGWRLHHDPNHNSQIDQQRTPIQGNAYRDVWKWCCWKASEDTRLSADLRALYGALVGNLRAMESVATSWEDRLWSQYRALVDQRAEAVLRQYSLQLRSPHPLPQDYPEERLSPEGIFRSIETRSKDVQTIHQAVQKFLILKDVGSLVQAVHSRLCLDAEHPQAGSGTRIRAQKLRGVTHLILVLKRLGQVSIEVMKMVNDILRACVKDATERGCAAQVARYCSALPLRGALRVYSDFLAHVAASAEVRARAAHLADAAGLPLQALLPMTAAKIRLSSFTLMPAPQPSSTSAPMAASVTAEDRSRLAMVEWLLPPVAPESTDDDGGWILRGEALRQTNALIRHFLIARKVTAAKAAFVKLPSDTVDVVMREWARQNGHLEADLPTHLQNRVREYLAFRTFFDAQESFTDWFDHYHQKRPSPPASSANASSGASASGSFQAQLAADHAREAHEARMRKWKATLSLITKKACERLYNVLLFPDGGWLMDIASDDAVADKSLESEERNKTEERWEDETEDDERGEDDMVVDHDSESEAEKDELIPSKDEVRERAMPADMSEADWPAVCHLEPEVAQKEPNRQHQMTTLRSVYVPQVTSLLQTILHATDNLKECVQLTDIVASETRALYKCFGVGEMQRFLFKMQDTCKELLDRNCDALGYPL